MFREDGQEYGQVTKMLGNGRLEALCFDGEKRLAHIRGKMRKKVSIVPVYLLYQLILFQGLDQPGRYHTVIAARFSGWKSGCYREIYL